VETFFETQCILREISDTVVITHEGIRVTSQMRVDQFHHRHLHHSSLLALPVSAQHAPVPQIFPPQSTVTPLTELPSGALILFLCTSGFICDFYVIFGFMSFNRLSCSESDVGPFFQTHLSPSKYIQLTDKIHFSGNLVS